MESLGATLQVEIKSHLYHFTLVTISMRSSINGWCCKKSDFVVCLVARFSRQSGTPCLMQGSETVDRAGDITGFIGVEPFHAQCLLPSSFLWWIPTTSLTKQSTPMNWRKFLLPSRMCLCIQWSVEAQVIPWCSVHEYCMISRARQAGEWF